MLLLTQLRWLAIAGQLVTILVVRLGMGVPLRVAPMLAILAALTLLNLMTLLVLRFRDEVANVELFLALLMDWAALTGQLYLSGGATNPFAPIGLLQVVLGAVLLEPWSSWALVTLHAVGFGVLALAHEPLDLPAPYASTLSWVHILASWVSFVLAAVLQVLFVTRIGRNLRARDARLAEMRQREAEETHIVRMGLLASGAAHELGTPLASLSVILGDWRREPGLAETRIAEIEDMQAAIARCKDIVTGILYASGEARSEEARRVTLNHFITELATGWGAPLTTETETDPGLTVIADRTLAQVLVNLLDNAVEAGAQHVVLRTELVDGQLRFAVRDDGPGFTPDMLARLGKPYTSSRARQGAGLGLFLAVNVMRKLGGTVTAANRPGGGAIVTLAMPVGSLALSP